MQQGLAILENKSDLVAVWARKKWCKAASTRSLVAFAVSIPGTGREDGPASPVHTLPGYHFNGPMDDAGPSSAAPHSLSRWTVSGSGAMARTEPPHSPKVAKAGQLALGSLASCMREKDMSC